MVAPSKFSCTTAFCYFAVQGNEVMVENWPRTKDL